MSEIPESRSYVHDRCEQPTEVSGTAFTSLASPLGSLQKTYCNACKDMFPVEEFRWADSGEKLLDYRQRHGQSATGFDRFIASQQAVIAMLAVAVVIGIATTAFFTLVQGNGLASAIACGIGSTFLSLIAMAAILISVLTPMAHKRACGVSDPRSLV